MTQRELVTKLNKSTRAMNRRNEDRLHGTYKGHAVALVCNICHQAPKNSKEVLEINAYGYHLTCDHVLADVMDQQKRDGEMMFREEDR